LLGVSKWVDFSAEFIATCDGVIPIVTATALSATYGVSIVEVTASGFKVVTTESTDLNFNWIAMAKTNKGSTISSSDLDSYKRTNQLEVEESTKQQMKAWAKSENEKAEQLTKKLNSKSN